LSRRTLFSLFLPFPGGIPPAALLSRALGLLSFTLFYFFLRAVLRDLLLSFLGVAGSIFWWYLPLCPAAVAPLSTIALIPSPPHSFSFLCFRTSAASLYTSQLSYLFFIFPWSLCSWHSPASLQYLAPFHTPLFSLFLSAASRFPRGMKTPLQPIMEGVFLRPPIMAKHAFPARRMLAQFPHAVTGGYFSLFRVPSGPVVPSREGGGK
jgi:hypothetical protein